MKGFETSTLACFGCIPKCKKECPAMKGFETVRYARRSISARYRKKECPAMKGFETTFCRRHSGPVSKRKKECPAMKGFETVMITMRRASMVM